MNAFAEFLVSVGYKLDTSSERRFVDSVESATLKANLLARAIENTVKQVWDSTQRMALAFDTLYYASERTNTSVQNLRAFSYAVAQTGGSAAGARGSLEALALKMRATGGGAEAFIRALGVQTRDAQGRLRDISRIANDLRGPLSRVPYFVALQYAQQLGIDEPTLRSILKGLDGFEAEYKRKSALVGLNNEEAAKRFMLLERAVRSFSGTVSAVFERLAFDSAPRLTQFIKWLDDWILSHPKEIQDAVRYIAEAAASFATAVKSVIDALTPMAQAFERWSQATVGQNGLTTGLEILAGMMVLRWVGGVLAPILKFRAGWFSLLAFLGIAGLASLAAGEAPGGEAMEGGEGGDPGHSGGSIAGQGGRGWRSYLPSWLGGSGASGDNAGRTIGGDGGNRGDGKIVGGANLMRGQYGAPGENLVTVTTPSGKRVTVHREAAASFKGFLGDLEAAGYKIKSLGGFAMRGKAGGGGISQHAYGNAIDINPAANPFRTSQTDLPSNVSQMAAKWGLSWGGDWSARSRDPMHFEWRGVRPWERGDEIASTRPEQPRKRPISMLNTFGVMNNGTRLGGSSDEANATINQTTNITVQRGTANTASEIAAHQGKVNSGLVEMAKGALE